MEILGSGQDPPGDPGCFNANLEAPGQLKAHDENCNEIPSPPTIEPVKQSSRRIASPGPGKMSPVRRIKSTGNNLNIMTGRVAEPGSISCVEFSKNTMMVADEAHSSDLERLPSLSSQFQSVTEESLGTASGRKYRISQNVSEPDDEVRSSTLYQTMITTPLPVMYGFEHVQDDDYSGLVDGPLCFHLACVYCLIHQADASWWKTLISITIRLDV